MQKNITELSARIEACEAQNQQQDITIEHNAESASTERDIITIHVHDNALGLADNIQRTVDLRKDLSELEVGTQTDLNQLNETIFEAVTKTQNELNRTQEELIPGVGSILPWIPSKIISIDKTGYNNTLIFLQVLLPEITPPYPQQFHLGGSAATVRSSWRDSSRVSPRRTSTGSGTSFAVAMTFL